MTLQRRVSNKPFSPLLMDGIGTMRYTSAQKLVDDFYPKGLQNSSRSATRT
jgi:hypothetical protein